jgi:hypothetical protein
MPYRIRTEIETVQNILKHSRLITREGVTAEGHFLSEQFHTIMCLNLIELSSVYLVSEMDIWLYNFQL